VPVVVSYDDCLCTGAKTHLQCIKTVMLPLWKYNTVYSMAMVELFCFH